MIRFLRYVVIAVVAIILVLFAFANHHPVIVSFDPFGSPDNAALAMTAPLFAVVIVFTMLGVIAGAAATWISQGRHRKASRRHRAEADKWRAQAEALKAGREPPALPHA
jgi:hypothetical protein